jgi:hypothetical protein
MTDEPRREPRSFEPPPWERERFDELARRRAEADAAAAALAREQGAAPSEQVVQAEGDGPGAAPLAQDAGPAAAAPAPAPTAAAAAPLDEARVDVMMMGLAAEEPPAFPNVWVVWLVTGCVFGVLGLASLVIGGAGMFMSRGAGIGTTWAVVLGMTGLAGLGAAAWMVAKALGERGA